jgi:putative membrane protein
MAGKNLSWIKWIRALPHQRYLAYLAVVYAVIWACLGWYPVDRSVWLLENVLVVFVVIGMAVCCRHLLLSRISYTLIFLFLCLHTVGAHYSYAMVPYDDWTEKFLGFRLTNLMGWERNHFDRLVHFLYGFLIAYPIREMFLRVVNVKGFWGYFLPLDLTMSTSMLFELVEWGVAEVFGGGAGTAYLGSQGDEWDAHRDMALASLGAVMAMLITGLINWRFQRDFAWEWAESLRVKHPQPLGEDEVARMAKKKKGQR